MRRVASRIWLVSVLVAACGGAGTPTSVKQSPTVTAPIATATEDAPEVASDDRPSVSPYPASPITELATHCTELVKAVIDGHPPPRGPLPIEPIGGDTPLVRAENGSPKSADLEFFAFAMELDIVLFSEGADAPTTRGSPGSPAPPPAPERDGTLRTVAFLSRTGLKLASVQVSAPRTIKPTASFLGGTAEVGRNVVDHARQGRLQQLLVGEPERPVIGNDMLFAQVLKELPKVETLRRAETLAREQPRALGVNADDMFVIARDRQGTLWGFALDLEEDEGQVMFDSRPLVRVQKADPRRGF